MAITWNHYSKKIHNYNPQNKNKNPRVHTDIKFLKEYINQEQEFLTTELQLINIERMM